MLTLSSTTTTQVQIQESTVNQISVETVTRLQQMRITIQQFEDYCNNVLSIALSDIISDKLVETFMLEGWSRIQSEDLVFNMQDEYLSA